jgi:uncharacterized protein
MRYQVADLLKSSIGSKRVLDLDDVLDPAMSELVLASPFRGRLVLIRDLAGILVEGALVVELELECARCLKPLVQAVEFDIEEHFRPILPLPAGTPVIPDPNEEVEAATDLDERHVMDLSAVIAQNLELALPLHPLCQEDCAGICPDCGLDRNEASCDCAPEPDPRWASLRDLRDVLAEGDESA